MVQKMYPLPCQSDSFDKCRTLVTASARSGTSLLGAACRHWLSKLLSLLLKITCKEMQNSNLFWGCPVMICQFQACVQEVSRGKREKKVCYLTIDALLDTTICQARPRQANAGKAKYLVPNPIVIPFIQLSKDKLIEISFGDSYMICIVCTFYSKRLQYIFVLSL